MAINEEERFTQDVCDQLDALLGSTDTSNVTSEGVGFEELPVGYYLVEVGTAKLTTTKTSKEPMVSIGFKVVENGLKINSDDEIESIEKTKNRVVYKNYLFRDNTSVLRYVSDMLCFLGENDEPLLPKEAWKSTSTMVDALDVLEAVKPRVWISNSLSKTPNEQGEFKKYVNVLSWKRAGALGLPVD